MNDNEYIKPISHTNFIKDIEEATSRGNVYNNTIYCDFWKKCMRSEDCIKALTDEVIEGAYKVRLPICKYGKEPFCFESEYEGEAWDV